MKENIFINNSLKISITNVCNYDCSYCSNEGQAHDSKEYMDLNFVKQFCKKILAENIFVKRVNITGGEPLLHPKLNEIVREIAKITECVALNTNASLLTRKKIIQLAKDGVTALKIGIDSVSGKMTKPCMKITNNYLDIVKDNIIFAKEIIPDTSLDVVLSEFNKDTINEVIRFIIEHKLNNSIFIDLVQEDFWENGVIPKKGIEVERLLKLLKKQANKIDVTYNEKKGIYSIIINDNIKISFALDYCTLKLCGNLCTRINSMGEMVPCIKERRGIKLYLDQNIEEQIVEANKKSFCDIN